MRRREFLRSTVVALGASGLATVAAGDARAASDRNVASAGGSARPAADASRVAAATTATPSDTPTATPSGTATATPSGSTELSPLASLPVSNGTGGHQATEAVVAADGETAFVSKLTGFHAVDVSDPANPEIVATRDDILADRGGPMTNLFDIKYNRGRLLVATEGGSPYTGIALFDVRDPADPRLVAAHPTDYHIHNCDLHGDHAYLTTGSRLDIIDVGRDDPAKAGEWALTDYDDAYAEVPTQAANLHDMYVQGERAYLAFWDAGTWILDVSDPSEPAHVGHATVYAPGDLTGLSNEELAEHLLEPPGNDHYVQPSDDGTLLAVGKESWNVESEGLDENDGGEDRGGPSGIALWDISDPMSPDELGYVDPPPVPAGETAEFNGGYWTTAHNFEIAGDFLYSSWYRGGVRVHDISDPTDPAELARWADGADASIWTAQVGRPGDFFVASSYHDPTDADGPGRFYVFPDPTDSDATVTPSGPEVTIPTATPTPTPTPTPEPAPTESPTPTPTPTRTEGSATDHSTLVGSPTTTPAPTPAERTDTAADTTDTTAVDGPGFGVLAALAGLGAGAWRLVGDAKDGPGD